MFLYQQYHQMDSEEFNYESNNQFYYEEFLTEPLDLVAQNSQQELISIDNFLINHTLSKERRSLMVKWIIYVFDTIYGEQNNDSLFSRAVHLMDVFLKKTTVVYSDKDVHLIGCTCIQMASQIEDASPIELETMYDTICHKKFTIDEINEFYQKTLETLEYNTNFPTSYSYLQNLSQFMFGQSQDYQSMYVQEEANNILRYCYRSYTMMQYNWLLLATTILGYAIHVFKQVHGYYQDLQGKDSSSQDVMKLIEIAGVNLADFENCFEILSEQFNCKCLEKHCSSQS
ncbi:unnamed protein product [Paramecium octaurelia]|uniref:Cyclin N-terminal domain-containing protein n=1 Tax=Paramecium octaurelia TaxID=43137 RepID=A0A8S1XA17_PAROT|nr:unnamed protein product [Paramecium octaurelia]